MNPGAHCELGDENIATLGKKNWSLGGDHLDFRIGLHDLLYPSQGQLMQLVVMVVAFQVVDGLLPISCQDVLVLSSQALVDLRGASVSWACHASVGVKTVRTLAHGPV